MTSESLTRQQREHAAGEELADALDAVSRPMADRILGRAIEMDHAAREKAEAAADTMDYDTLKEIALEVGISEESLKKALLEELDTDKDHNATAIEKVTVPKGIRGGLIVDGPADEVQELLAKILDRARGLAEEARQGQHIEWTPRTAGRDRERMESWTISQSRGDRQLVELDIDARSKRKKAWQWIVGLVILSIVFGNFLPILAALAFWGFGMFVVVGWLRRFSRRARRNINGILSSLSGGDDAHDDWLTLWERSRRR